jgi:hypothetical protein
MSSSSRSSAATSSAAKSGAAKSKTPPEFAKAKSAPVRAAIAVKAPAAAAAARRAAPPALPDKHDDDAAAGDDHDIDNPEDEDEDEDGDENEDGGEDDGDEAALSASAAALTLVDPAAAASKALRAVRRLVRGTKIHFTRAHIRDVVVASAHALGYRCVRPFRGSASNVVPDIVWVGMCCLKQNLFALSMCTVFIELYSCLFPASICILPCSSRAEASPLPVAEVRALEPRQRVNFFPGMKLCATKCEFSRIIKRMQSLFPGEFDFVPRTWSLPAENAEFRACARVKRRPQRRGRRRAGGAASASTSAAAKAAASSSNSESDNSNDSSDSDNSDGSGDGARPPPRTYIVKPDAGCGGDGIYLTSKAARIPADAACVVQEYLERPLLLNGLKFDLRVYVLLTSVAPLRYFVCREGLARMAVEPYQVSDGSEIEFSFQGLRPFQ